MLKLPDGIVKPAVPEVEEEEAQVRGRRRRTDGFQLFDISSIICSAGIGVNSVNSVIGVNSVNCSADISVNSVNLINHSAFISVNSVNRSAGISINCVNCVNFVHLFAGIIIGVIGRALTVATDALVSNLLPFD